MGRAVVARRIAVERRIYRLVNTEDGLAKPAPAAYDVEPARLADDLLLRLVIDERLRKGDELEELFDTFLQMTYSLRAIQSARLGTLDDTLKKAEDVGAPQEVIDGMRALRAQMVLGIERRRASIPPPMEV